MIYYNFDQFPAVMRPNQVADALQIGRNTTYELLRSGRIKSVRVGNQIRISKESLIQFIQMDNN